MADLIDLAHERLYRQLLASVNVIPIARRVTFVHPTLGHMPGTVVGYCGSGDERIVTCELADGTLVAVARARVDEPRGGGTAA